MPKRPRPRPQKSSRALHANPVALAIVRANVMAQLRSMQTMAMLHAIMGANNPKLVHEAARVVYIAAAVARAQGVPADHPDARIMAGTALALADLAEGTGTPELHRASIASGLAAAQRLLEPATPTQVATAAVELDHKLATDGLSVWDIAPPSHKILEIAR